MTRAASPGPDDSVTINGTDLVLPRVLEPQDILAQALTVTAGRPRLDAWRYGDGLPNVADRFEFALEYDLSERYAETCAYLERLRTQGGVHLFADWKSRMYTYTARAGQQFFYLPRQDAFSLGYDGHDTAGVYDAVIKLNDVELDVVYQASVASGDVVPEGEVWIGDATVVHPEAGFVVAPFKIGTPIEIYDDVLVEFCALYRVVVTGVPTVPFELAGREDKTLYLAEVA